jgi:hypothetical protein
MNLYASNQTFKNHMEKLHFQSLLGGLSTRDFNLKPPQKSSLTFDCATDEEQEEMMAGRSCDFWESPPELRSEMITMFLGVSYGDR